MTMQCSSKTNLENSVRTLSLIIICFLEILLQVKAVKDLSGYLTKEFNMAFC